MKGFSLEPGCENYAAIVEGGTVSWNAVRVVLMILVRQKLDKISRLGLVFKDTSLLLRRNGF